MDSRLLKQFVEIAKIAGYVILATSDKDGRPHIATAAKLEYETVGDWLKISEWFCSKTVANLHVNEHISIVAWQPETDKGYQLLCKLKEVRNSAVLNGYTEKEAKEHIPQSKHELLVEVEKITEFSHAVHSDEDLMNLHKEVKI